MRYYQSCVIIIIIIMRYRARHLLITVVDVVENTYVRLFHALIHCNFAGLIYYTRAGRSKSSSSKLISI